MLMLMLVMLMLILIMLMLMLMRCIGVEQFWDTAGDKPTDVVFETKKVEVPQVRCVSCPIPSLSFSGTPWR